MHKWTRKKCKITIKNKSFKNEKKLNWAGRGTPLLWYEFLQHELKGSLLLSWTFQGVLGQPCGGTAGCFNFLLGVGLVDGVPTGVVVVGLVGLVCLCFGFSKGNLFAFARFLSLRTWLESGVEQLEQGLLQQSPQQWFQQWCLAGSSSLQLFE